MQIIAKIAKLFCLETFMVYGMHILYCVCRGTEILQMMNILSQEY